MDGGEEDPHGMEEVSEGSALLELLSHDLINQQQAALSLLELLEGSPRLSEAERALLGRTVQALEHTARLLLQVRTAIVHRERDLHKPTRVLLDREVERARCTAEGAFATKRLTVDTSSVSPGVEVLADELLADLLTHLFLLLGEAAPTARSCRLVVSSEVKERSVVLRLASEGFALSPLVTEALTNGEEDGGWTRTGSTVSLVSHLVEHYGGTLRMERAPPGKVGAYLVIELPLGAIDDAARDDSG